MARPQIGRRFSLSPEQAAVLADDQSPTYMAAGFQPLAAVFADLLCKGQLAMVRFGLARVLHERVIPLFGAHEHAVEALLDERDQRRLQTAWRISSEPAELARAP